MSGDAARMSIEPRVQGCFCESLGEQAGVVHLTVLSVMPGTSLRLSGGLGPLGLMGVYGNMTWDFEDVDGARAWQVSKRQGPQLDDMDGDGQQPGAVSRVE